MVTKKFAIYRTFKSGRIAKTPIVVLEAATQKQAYFKFGEGRWWSGYSENTGFKCIEMTENNK